MKKAKPYDSALAQEAASIMQRPRGKGIIQRVETRHVAVVPSMTEPLDGSAARIKLKHIRPDPKQPRKTIDKQRLKELADSIRQRGVPQPVVVTYRPKKKAYYLVTGERRYQAAKLAGLSTIPAIIQPSDYDEKGRLADQLTENAQRENLPPIEEARAVQTLMDALKLTQLQAAEKIGKPKTYIAELQGILRISPKNLDRAKGLPKRALVEISKAKKGKEQDELLAAALDSKTPMATAKNKRAGNSNYARTRLNIERYKGAKVTVEIPKTLDVSAHEVLRAAARQAKKG